MTARPDDTHNLRASAQEIDALLADPERPRVDAPLPFTSALARALTSPAGRVDIHLAQRERLESHVMTLSRAGLIVLHSARSDAGQAQLSLLPITVLPGALARLTGIAPTLPCAPGSVMALPEGAGPDRLFSADEATREVALCALEEASAQLLGSAPPAIADAPTRAMRVQRTRKDTQSSAFAAQLHGRFLLADPQGRLVGTDPTSLTRALVRAALARS